MGYLCHQLIRYDTIAEFNVDWLTGKADQRSRSTKLKIWKSCGQT